MRETFLAALKRLGCAGVMLGLLLGGTALAQVSSGTTTGTTTGTGTQSRPFRNLTEQQRTERLAAASLSATPDKAATQADIQAMRAEGLGWGQIAQRLGLHPSTVGMGTAKAKSAKSGTKSKGAAGSSVGKSKGNDSGGLGANGLGAGASGGGGAGGGKGGGKGGGGGKK